MDTNCADLHRFSEIFSVSSTIDTPLTTKLGSTQSSVPMSLVKHDRSKECNDLKAFSQQFALRTIVPEDMLPLITKDQTRQHYLREKSKALIEPDTTTDNIDSEALHHLQSRIPAVDTERSLKVDNDTRRYKGTEQSSESTKCKIPSPLSQCELASSPDLSLTSACSLDRSTHAPLTVSSHTPLATDNHPPSRSSFDWNAEEEQTPDRAYVNTITDQKTYSRSPEELLACATEQLSADPVNLSIESAEGLVDHVQDCFNPDERRLVASLLRYGTLSKGLAEKYEEEYASLHSRDEVELSHKVDTGFLNLSGAVESLFDSTNASPKARSSVKRGLDELKSAMSERKQNVAWEHNRTSGTITKNIKLQQDVRDALRQRDDESSALTSKVVETDKKLRASEARGAKFKSLAAGHRGDADSLRQSVRTSGIAQQDLVRQVDALKAENAKLTKAQEDHGTTVQSLHQSNITNANLRQRTKEQDSQIAKLVAGRNELVHEKIRLESRVKNEIIGSKVPPKVGALKDDVKRLKASLLISQSAERTLDEQLKTSNATSQALRKREHTLESRVKLLEAEREQSELDTKAALQAQNEKHAADLQNERQAQEATMSQLQCSTSERDACLESNETLNKELQSVLVQHESACTARANSATQLKAVIADHEIVDRKHEKLQRSLVDHKKTIKDLRSEAKRHQRSHRVIQNNYHELSTGFKDEKRRGDEAVEEASKADSENKSLTQRVADLTKQLNKRNEGRSIFEGKISELTSDLDASKQEVRRLQDQRDCLTTDLSQQRDAFVGLRIVCQVANDRYRRCNERMEAYDREYAALLGRIRNPPPRRVSMFKRAKQILKHR
ncbi:MAG: hypothetical protein M1828_004647 [Chrysothrix sp. TS-e1954]|nr:MAG: hypothetical protein M1828_004647 [Chrysothrix sp. TS-e1954]